MICYLQIVIDGYSEIPIQSPAAETPVPEKPIILKHDIPCRKRIASMMRFFYIGVIGIEDTFLIIVSSQRDIVLHSKSPAEREMPLAAICMGDQQDDGSLMEKRFERLYLFVFPHPPAMDPLGRQSVLIQHLHKSSRQHISGSSRQSVAGIISVIIDLAAVVSFDHGFERIHSAGASASVLGRERQREPRYDIPRIRHGKICYLK